MMDNQVTNSPTKKMGDMKLSPLAILLGLLLFLIAWFAWSKTKSLSGLIDKNCSTEKDALNEQLKMIRNLTFALWLVPLLISLVGIIFLFSHKKKVATEKKKLQLASSESTEQGQTMATSSRFLPSFYRGSGVSHPASVNGGAVYRCEIPSYTRPVY